MKMKYFIAIFILMVVGLSSALNVAMAAQPVFVYFDDGTYIDIPEGYTACPFDPVYQVHGYDENGNFPLLKLSEAIKEKIESCEIEADIDMVECVPGQLVVSPAVCIPAGGG